MHRNRARPTLLGLFTMSGGVDGDEEKRYPPSHLLCPTKVLPSTRIPKDIENAKFVMTLDSPRLDMSDPLHSRAPTPPSCAYAFHARVSVR